MQFMGTNQNIDDVMQGSMNSKSSLMASGSLKRPLLAIRTVSPLAHQVPSDNTSPTPPMMMRHNLDFVPKSRSTSFHDTDLRTGASHVNGHGWRGMAKPDNNIFQQGTKERKRNEPTISSKIKDILEWKLGTGVHHERKDSGDHGSKKTAEGMRELWKSRRVESPRNKGPRAGQIYEIVNQHIIEDSMDRTVTISTWREQADEGHGSDTDSTSIYYISPGGYAREDAHMLEVNADFGRSLLGSRHKDIQGTSSYGAVEANNGPSSITTKVRSIPIAPPMYGRYDVFSRVEQASKDIDMPSITMLAAQPRILSDRKTQHSPQTIKGNIRDLEQKKGTLALNTLRVL